MKHLFSAIVVVGKENLRGTETTISCTVTDLSEQMSITWTGFTAGNNFVPSEGVYDSETNSQTGTLTVKSGAVTEDSTYTCTITSISNTESADKSVEVLLNVYGK